MISDSAYGWYGKVPCLGDFIRANLSPPFVRNWDRWMQALLIEGRKVLGQRWRTCYLEAPIWRFALSPGLCGPRGAVGIVMPSVDQTGRQFPLCLGAETDAPAWPAFLGAEPVYAPLEAAALAMLEDHADLPLLASALTAIPPMPTLPCINPITADKGWTIKTSHPVAKTLAGLTEKPSAAIWVAIVGGENRLLLTEGLPEGSTQTRAFFDLDARCWTPPDPVGERT